MAQNKSGLDNVDRNKVNQIIYEMSKDSAYYKNERRKDEKTKERITQIHQRLKEVESRDSREIQQKVDSLIIDLEATRCLTKVWAHFDMDGIVVVLWCSSRWH
eukprot:TRINITY_DN7957_c0_g1_i9.p1 TRINITY_DN7957_c0_g1~~TRINITY_DN7957_c0_g1_i9.p1  ORF type:complete len:103 (-),score=25.47 TRINITY_DN7957_c0_g1_i9:123-431(-)